MPRRPTTKPSSGYTILVVDDQESVVVSTTQLLEREGHRVLAANGGHAALEIFATHAIDVLLVDYFMPKMSGEELVTAIRRRDTDVQIILQTGYAGEKPPREMLATLDIQGYHDKSEGPEKLLLWIGVALKACRQLRRVRDAERLKSQIIANVSHEFRTPLNVILGYSELLQAEGWVAPEGVQAIGAVHRYGEMLLHLVAGFLRLADIDAAVDTDEDRAVTTETLRTELARWGDYFVAGKPIALTIDVPDDLPPLRADEGKLQVILMNLLSNAGKFTAGGRIGVTATSDDTDVRVAIRDTGVGIAPENLEVIFEPFRQMADRRDGYRDGTGIGLTIARKLARQMAGDITVESTPGTGSTFVLTLPRSTSAAACTERPRAVVAG